VLKLKRENDLAPEDSRPSAATSSSAGFDIAGGGAFGPKIGRRTKEQADYNLKYLLQRRCLATRYDRAQLEQSRIRPPTPKPY